MNAGGGEGAEVVYSLKNNSELADLILNNIGEEGQIERRSYQRLSSYHRSWRCTTISRRIHRYAKKTIR